VKRSALFLLTLLTGGIAVQAFAQGMAATPPPAPMDIGKITSAAVWQPSQEFLTKARNFCDKSMAAMSFPECFMNQIAAAGAPAEAVAFTRYLYAHSDGQVGIMSAFKSYGKVGAAQVFYPLRANDNYGLLLIDGEPKILDVDDLKRLDQQTMQQSRAFQALKKEYPQADLWPGDRSGSSPWPQVRTASSGDTEFTVIYPLINGCHACARVGVAKFAWDFDAAGMFVKTDYLSLQPTAGVASQQ
jgi:hypothetical protein